MPHDPILLADTKAWLRKAATDLRAATLVMEADPPLLEDAVFHAQQAAENSFKAFLTFHDEPFRKTHSLEEIGEACLKLDRRLKELVDEAVPLSEYAWAYRYPGTWSPPVWRSRGPRYLWPGKFLMRFLAGFRKMLALEVI